MTALQPPQVQTQLSPAVQTQSWAAWLLDAYASTATSPVTADFPHEDGHEDSAAKDDPFSQKDTVRMQQQQQTQQRWYEDSASASASTPTSATSTLSPASARSFSSASWGPSGSARPGAGRSVSAYAPSQNDHTTQQLYARTGRGGAGNYLWGSLGTGRASVLSTSEQNDQGGMSLSQRRAAARRLQRIETVPASTKEGRIMNLGRGGAGNYAPKSPSMLTPMGAGDNGGLRSVSAPTPVSAGLGGGGYGRGGAGNMGRAEEERDRKRREVRDREMVEEQQRRERIEALVDGWLMPPPVAMVGIGRRGSGSWD